jgi:leader peptidase (prepilin peptidase)/N-methyltransferase
VTPALVAACAVLGLLVGSFLNVVIHRVPQGLSLVRPPSACPACGHRVLARDNVPVLSWLVLRGRCRHCGVRISARYPMVEVATALLWAGVAWWLGPDASLPAWLYLASIAVALSAIDLDLHRLPDAIVLPSYAVGAVLLGGASLAEGDPAAIVRALVGAVALGGLYLVLHLVRPDGMGFGDVKLAGVLGLYLGYLGWGPLAVGAFAAFLLGGVVGLAVMAARSSGRGTRIPFGPFMLAGALLALVVGDPVSTAYLRLVGL